MFDVYPFVNLLVYTCSHSLTDFSMDGYLCELAGAQIRDGLHIMGKVPEGETMIDMLQALTRLSNLEIASLRGAIAALFDLDASELLENPFVEWFG